MKIVRAAVYTTGLLAIGNLGLVLAERHEELLDYLAEITHRLGIILALDDLEHPESDIPAKPIPADVTPTPPALPPNVVGILYSSDGGGKVAVIRSDGGRTIHTAHRAKWQHVSHLARLVDGIDVEALEAQLLADNPRTPKVELMSPKVLNNATGRLVGKIMKPVQ